MEFNSINPFNNKVLAHFKTNSNGEMEQMINDSHQAYVHWRSTSFATKKEMVLLLSKILMERLDSYSELITAEMGKPLLESIAELKKCADLCDFYALHAENYLAAKNINEQATIVYEPMGIIVGIMPWNFPFWQAFRFAIPTILAGNTVIIKHAPNTPQCAVAIEQLFIEAGFPIAVFQNIRIDIPQVETLLAHAYVMGVSLTGSTAAGASVATLAGKYLKKSVLELGGNDAFIVTRKAHLGKAAQKAVLSRCRNNGQSCVAAKRFIIDATVYDEFKQLLQAEISQLTIGNPRLQTFTNGPLARVDLYEKAQQQIALLAEKNFSRVYGLPLPKDAQNTIPPAIWEGTETIEEEIFAPIFLLYKAQNIDEMVRIANDTAYGLGASIWSDDPAEAQLISRQLVAGMVYINELVHSEPSMPFGGIKQSGMGKELGEEGIKEFTNQKLIFNQL